jgi:hypothetical protein
MKCVIDSNQMRTEKLRQFLSKSHRNMAVLPDFVAMEAYKGNSLITIFESMSVLSDFPEQVVVLKRTSKVLLLQGKSKGLQQRLIDKTQTRKFQKFIRDLNLAKNGDVFFQKQIIEHGHAASEHFEIMRNEALKMSDAIQTFGKKSYATKEDRAALRSREKHIIDKVVHEVMEIAGGIFRELSGKVKLPSYSELGNTFIFRSSFIYYLNGLERFSLGQLNSMKPKDLQNDFVDMMIVTYGTYFDGLMTSDRNAQKMFNEARLLLFDLFNAVVPSLEKKGNALV